MTVWTEAGEKGKDKRNSYKVNRTRRPTVVGNEKKKSRLTTNLLFLDWVNGHAIHHDMLVG